MENVTFKSDKGTINELLLDGGEFFLIYVNNVEIGSIKLHSDDISIYIEIIDLKEEYTRKGYGTKILNKLKDIGKSIGIKYIEGECPSHLIKFYTKLGADFNYRKPEDETYMNNRFYIDL